MQPFVKKSNIITMFANCFVGFQAAGRIVDSFVD